MVQETKFKARFTLECKARLLGEQPNILDRDLTSLDYDSAIDESAIIAANLLKEQKSYDSVGFCVFTKGSEPRTESRIRSGGAPRNTPKYQ